jgi:DNA-binding transcriptional regulator YbjK
MAHIRVPYPKEPERRQALLDRALSLFGHYGTHEGTTEAGSFQASTPVGGVAGTYRSLEDSSELEVKLTKKPWVVPTSLIEHELRKFVAQV